MKIMKTLFIGALLLMAAFVAVSHGVEIVSFEGTVDITPKGKDVASPVKAGMQLGAGDRIVTGERSSARLSFTSDNLQTIDVNEKSDVILILKDGEKIDLISGEVFAKIKGLKKGEEFQVRTPCATCGARGTEWLTTASAEKTDISVIDGSVFTRGINKDGTFMKKEYLVKKGYGREIKKFKQPKGPKKMPKSRLKKIETRFTRDGIKFSPVISRTGDLAVKDISTRAIIDQRETLETRDAIDTKTRMIDDRVDSKIIERSDRMDKRGDLGSRKEAIRKPPPKRPPIRKPIIRR